MNARNLLREIRKLKNNPDCRISLIYEGEEIAVINGSYENEVDEDEYKDYYLDCKHDKKYLLYKRFSPLTIIIDDFKVLGK